MQVCFLIECHNARALSRKMTPPSNRDEKNSMLWQSWGWIAQPPQDSACLTVRDLRKSPQVA
jgi:hypothetical protein